MKTGFFKILFPILVLAVLPTTAFSASNPDHIEPCGLIAKEKVFAAFPALQKMEKQTIGLNTTCNFLDKFGIPALIISVGRADHQDAQKAIQGMGDGYSYQTVPDLGNSAALALTKGNPKFGIQGGLVAELHVIKNNSFVNLAPVRLEVPSDGPVFAQLKNLAVEMANHLP